MVNIAEFDLTCVGDINLDIITDAIKKYPSKDEQIIVDDIKLNIGGSSALCACASSTLGLRTSFIGKCGSDFYSLLLEKLRSYNVHANLSKSERTALTIAITFQDGSRSFITRRGANSELELSDINFELIELSRHLHIAGIWHITRIIPHIKRILRFAKEHDLTTSLDVGATIKEENWEILYDFLRYIDILFLNELELKFLTRKNLENGINELRDKVDILSIHLGRKGAITVNKGKIFKSKAFKIKVLNPTGAGDVFNAGFIYCFLNKKRLDYATKFAIANASVYITRNWQRFPTINETNRFLEQQK
ncbi:MAG: carbohydrate kinase family protein [Candidatus Parvarchaeota archaeon]|nr:carbohydrate kinase family protein [Candidatus Jingweiarchaeum tengchongense]MCW1309340.1 carbohydrate kinase family protein [Candidatus Jingweiarchaeum tengchongense]